MRKTDLAYVAGIIDGEGCIGLYRRSNYSCRVRVSVVNTNEWLCQSLKFTFGGLVSCNQNRDGNRKPLWRWMVSNRKALSFLKLIRPYLRLKKPQAEIAIMFQEQRQNGGHRLTEEERALIEAQRIIMASLNKKGNPIIKS